MNETKRIADQLQRAYDGDAWCGASLRESLRGVTAEVAARRSIPGAHSIWEITLHVATWMGAVRERIEGEYVREPAEGDWQVVTDTSDAAWADALARLENNHNDLLRAVAELADEELGDLIGTERDRALGSGVSRYVTLQGTAQHSLYHAGQIMLLKKSMT